MPTEADVVAHRVAHFLLARVAGYDVEVDLGVGLEVVLRGGDDLVVDPFTGSSTTGIAAVSHGRRYIGCDVSQDYLDISVRRFEDLL